MSFAWLQTVGLMACGGISAFMAILCFMAAFQQRRWFEVAGCFAAVVIFLALATKLIFYGLDRSLAR